MAPIRRKLETYAITISTFQQHRHFQKDENAILFLETLFRYRAEGRFLLHAFAIMPDHLHVLLTPALSQPTARILQLLKGGYSHARASKTAIWHSGHYEHRIRDTADFEAQRKYIANNPGGKLLENYPWVHTNYPSQLDVLPTASPPPTPQN